MSDEIKKFQSAGVLAGIGFALILFLAFQLGRRSVRRVTDQADQRPVNHTGHPVPDPPRPAGAPPVIT